MSAMTDQGPLWTTADLVTAAAGNLDGAAPPAITGISIDTRALAPGDLFVALTDQRDGHDFVSAAFRAGAAAALVRASYQRLPGDGALVRVDDPLQALERIATAARRRLAASAKVIAVTGSAGKTGTKEMLRACLAPFGPTHAPEKSFNNHWGVPLTLARMPAATQFAVIEIGMNHAGEITPLARLAAPHIALITNVLPVHVGNFPDGEIGVANAKAEIFDGLCPGGTAILLAESPHRHRLIAKATQHGATIVEFGVGEGRIRAIRFIDAPSSTRITVATSSGAVDYEIGAPGRHLAINSLAVVATLEALGLPLKVALEPLADIRAPAGRGAREKIRLPHGEALLIDESYNANPASMRAALATLAVVSRTAYPRRLAVLGDMRELGQDAHALHLGLKDAVIQSEADLVFACGEHMRALFDALPAKSQGAWRAASTDIAALVAAAIRPQDVIMIKGSLGTNMAPIVKAVRALAIGSPAA